MASGWLWKRRRPFEAPTPLGSWSKTASFRRPQFRREISQLLDEFTPVALIGPLLAREVQLLADIPNLAAVPFITPTATLPDVKQFGRYWFSTAMTPTPPDQPSGGLCHAALRAYSLLYPGPLTRPMADTCITFFNKP